MINITEASVHDSKGFSQQVFKKGTIIVEDRGYFDFALMLERIKAGNIFVTRIKDNTVYETIEELELPEDADYHILKDELIRLTGKKAIDTGIKVHSIFVLQPLLRRTATQKKLTRLEKNLLEDSQRELQLNLGDPEVLSRIRDMGCEEYLKILGSKTAALPNIICAYYFDRYFSSRLDSIVSGYGGTISI